LKISAQIDEDDLWTKISTPNITKSLKISQEFLPKSFDLYQLDLAKLKEKLERTPKRGEISVASNIILPFPNGSGIFENFQILEASAMEDDLQEKYPEIRSYVGKGVNGSKSIIRLSVTPFGISCILLNSESGTIYIEPYSKDGLSYMVYSEKDLPEPEIQFECDVIDEMPIENSLKSLNASTNISDGILRKYRLALTCTAEFSQIVLTQQGISPTSTIDVKKAAILSYLNDLLAKVNAVFERDVSLTLVLVASNAEIIFLDSEKDGLTNEDMYKLIIENISICDSLIGNPNYDLGHVLYTNPAGGLAGLNSVCNKYKAMGVSYGFRITTILHEMGHQFGAGHTYNNCYNFNISPESSVEIGCGNSIMSYGGNQTIPFFHSISIEEIRNSMNFSTCATLITTQNAVPTANAGIDYIIPKSTPFILKGDGTDIDQSELTFNWEQIDPEVTPAPPSSFAKFGPVFKFVPPSTSPNRYFPELSTVISGNISSTWEVIPSVARKLNFSFIVRDNDIRGGRIAIDKMVITVDGTSGPFAIKSQLLPEEWFVGESKTVLWDVANTNKSPVNVLNVNILLSIDRGHSFPIILKSNTPNDGFEDIIVPNNLTHTGRIKVEAIGNIFYTLNPAYLRIKDSEYVLRFERNSIDLCLPNIAEYDFIYFKSNSFEESVAFSASGIPSGATVLFNPISVVSNETKVKMTVMGLTSLMAGKYEISINTTSSQTSIEKNTKVSLNLYNSTFKEIEITYPANNSTNLELPLHLIWNKDLNAQYYDIEVASDDAFLNKIESINSIMSNDYYLSNIRHKTSYYWRIKPKNQCSDGYFSEKFKFTTGGIYVPDDNFEKALIDYGYDDILDDYVSLSKIANVISINVNNKSINDLTGIEEFTSLSNLDCGSNQITNINLTKNKKLTKLWVDANKLAELDLSQNVSLEQLSCMYNQIKELDFSHHPEFKNLDCSLNQLKYLNVKNGVNSLWANFDARYNPNLTCIQVDNADWSNKNWIYKDAIASYSENCNYTNRNEVKLLNNSLSVYPNPTTGLINIEGISRNERIKISVYDMSGKLIKKKSVYSSGATIDISKAKPGPYLIIINNQTFKVVKK
jgi:trimeric autotransporter adhesin